MGNRFVYPNRREVLRGLSAGLMGAAVGAGAWPRPLRAAAGPAAAPAAGSGKRVLWVTQAPPAKVSLVKGNDRREIVFQSLKNLENEIIPTIGNKRILIKPNFVSTSLDLAASHVDEVRAILDFLKPHCKQQIIIGESAAGRPGGTSSGYKNFGYLALEKEYNVKLTDLNEPPIAYRYVFGRGNRPRPIRVCSPLLDKDVYIISAAKMKTHDRVVTTLSLKNVLMAAPVNDARGSDKRLMHDAYNDTPHLSSLHYNMFHLAQEIYPDLGVIDGFVAMEGRGPVGGTPLDAKIALASLDPLALDTLATKLMGFDPSKIMYLSTMAEAGMGQGDLSKIEVVGTPVDQCQYHFQLDDRLTEAYGMKA